MAHAIVFGASGVGGWAVVDQLLKGYPSRGTFTKVTALFNRPLSFKESMWQDPISQGIDFEIKFGIDLTRKSSNDVITSIKENVSDIGTVTHAFYMGYKAPNDPRDLETEVEVNGNMLQNAVDALNELSPNLKFLSLLTGAKAYGVTLPEQKLKPPFDETMVLPEPELSLTFYTKYRKILTKASEGKSWTWTDFRPDLIVGFEPRVSHFNMVAHWGRYFSTWLAIHGPGSKIPFPGVDGAYKCLANHCSASHIARFAIWASLNPEICGNGEAFNIADTVEAHTMEKRWPALAKYFGLEGISPAEVGYFKPEEVETVTGFLNKHKDVTEKLGFQLKDVNEGSLLDGIGLYLTFDRQLNVEKLIKTGFKDDIDPNQSWYDCWDLFRKLGTLPKDI